MASEASDDLDRLWREKPAVVAEFRRRHTRYGELCREVEHVLRVGVRRANVQVAGISTRVKSLDDIAEKVYRKEYEDPLNDVTDVAGVRIVFLYRSDLRRVEKVIRRDFQVIEWSDKVDERAPTEFGYGAVHCLVKLRRRSSGARYEDLKNFICEIQVRTVLQDAWATISRHLAYKQDVDAPDHLLRKIYALAGDFSTADDQFDTIRAEREKYVRQVRRRRAQREAFLAQELDLDTLLEYIKWKFSAKKSLPHDSLLRRVLAAAQTTGLKTLADIDTLVRRTNAARAAIRREIAAPNGAVEVNRAIALVNPAHQKTFSFETRNRIREHSALVQN